MNASSSAPPTEPQSAPGTADRDWSDYWRKEGAGGEVFVGAGKERNPHLAAFWQGVFATLPAGSRVVDIASGAGSIFAELGEDHGFALTASDVSATALGLLAERIPGVRTDVADATSLPYADGAFDLVVSQFGVEYAGTSAFAEAARLVAPGGRLTMLSHCADGYVDARTAPQLRGAEVARDSNFALNAASLMRALASRDPQAQRQAAAAFNRSEQTLGAELQRNPEGIHAHLYRGFQQLYAERASYALADTLQWLNDVSKEVAMAIARLSRMHTAALDARAVGAAIAAFEAAGLTMEASDADAERPARQLQLPNHDRPLAWQLVATRPQR